jgi:16S rRNA processing protein RimM
MDRPPSSIPRTPREGFVLSAEASGSSEKPTSGRSQGVEREPTAKLRAWLLLARLIRPHGRKGELVAEVLTDFPERFHERKRLFLVPPERIGTRPREVHLENFWFLRSRIVLKFQGIDSINEADGLRGYEVAIPHEERAPLDPGSVYVGDLIGCTVFDLNQEGAEVGEIMDVDRGSSSAELLVLRRRGLRMPAAEALIPFVREYLVRIDLGNRRIEMRLPEGLLDINAPLTEEEKRETGSRG